MKPPKGTIDITPDEYRIREYVLEVCEDTLKLHGAERIDTPIFELKHTLTGKIGEKNKSTYDLQDQDGELLSLRYDLTVPFARYVASNDVSHMRRYQIGNVYRDNCESMQCNFDICGDCDKKFADGDVLSVLNKIISGVRINKYTIYINECNVLLELLRLAGVTEDKLMSVCSSIDKLNDVYWPIVKLELISKGIPEDQIDNIYKFIALDGDLAGITNALLEYGPTIRPHVEYIKSLINHLDESVVEHIKFKLTLAHGLEYYTGLIFEVKVEGRAIPIAYGGRYDNLIEKFSNRHTPSVGVSIDINRICEIIRPKVVQPKYCTTFICTSQDVDPKYRVAIADIFRNAGICAAYSYNTNISMHDQLKEAEAMSDYAIILRQTEVMTESILVKNMKTKDVSDPMSIDRALTNWKRYHVLDHKPRWLNDRY